MSDQSSNRTPSRALGMAFFRCALILVAVAGCGTKPDSNNLLRLARLKVAAGDVDDAVSLIAQIPTTDARWIDGQFLSGDTLMNAGRFDEAITVWTALIERREVAADKRNVFFYAGQCCRELGRLTEAEEYLRSSIRIFPKNGAAHDHLGFLLCGSGRTWEAGQHFEILARSGSATLSQLALLGDLERPVEQRSYFEAWQQVADDDRIVTLGLAVHDFREGQAEHARASLLAFVEQYPEFADAQAMLGELLIDAPTSDFQRWHDGLSASAARHPGIWYVRGMFARKHGELEIAANCLQRALSITPTHRRAWYQLSQVLHSLNRETAAPTARYAELLLKVSEAIDNVLRTEGGNPATIETLVLLLEQTGRIWEACMGIAAADCTQDGRLDLFVTNFLHEANTFYCPVGQQIFQDKTQEVGLFEPSLPNLGFGTQFLDANLDGRPELFVANGYTQDLSQYDVPYKMKPQMFEWTGTRFASLAESQLGPWSSVSVVGRSVARLDWNIDGKPDLAVGLLDAPSFFLTNTSNAPANHYVSLGLVATESARDAIGAVVTVMIGGSSYVHQLTAGDGYQCTNERRINIGCGPAASIDRLKVEWPSGAVQEFTSVSTSMQCILVEGHGMTNVKR